LSSADAAHAARHSLEHLWPDEPFFDALEHYVALLLEANRRVNLTRVVEPDAVARLHLLDALAALPLVDALAPTRAIDLGSGGGVPGLPLAIARPAIAWTLVDSVGKKAALLRAFADRLGLTNVSVLTKRAETLGRDLGHRERYGLVTARACAPLPVLAELALPLLLAGGRLIAWKGPLSEGDPEVRRGNAASALLGGSQLLLAEPGHVALGGHRFVIAEKVTRTPARFPRRAGEPARRPLG
jgi:16S rRNA (guanine527-N7)-methyltransferase